MAEARTRHVACWLLTVRILLEIRDEMRGTNLRLDGTNERLDQTNERRVGDLEKQKA